MFSAAFSAAFVHAAVSGGGFIAPCMAQAALAAGAAWSVDGAALVIGGKTLIGPAGKVYQFASNATAEKWAQSAALVPVREAQIIASIPQATAEAWKATKRTRLEVIAAQVVSAAARTADADKRAALIAEAGYLLGKWAG